MKKLILVASLIIIVIGVGTLTFFKLQKAQRSMEFTKISNMKLESSAFSHNQSIPIKYTCDGENINPPLKISEIPEGTKSLVLNMDDPDAPAGVWNHWLVWDIPPGTTEIQEGQNPPGTIGKNTGGEFGYQGPCPPDREHRYWFELWALDIVLNLPKETSKNEIEEAFTGHVLAKAELMGRYNRK